MIRRRCLALLSAITMIHLSVVAGDAACAEHGTMGRHDASAHAMAMGHPSGARASTPPCDTPAQQRCCETMTSCSVTVAVARPVSLATEAPAAALVGRAPANTPTSTRPAPEPPPPKA
jgi:hypothetical protein